MSQKNPAPLAHTRPVQGSEWMQAIRDYRFDVTPAEFALGSLYGTCGNWGQRVYLSDVAVADILGVKRHTVGGWRKGLLAKSLIEDIGQHDSNPSQREYRLTLPADLPKLRKGEAEFACRKTARGVANNRPGGWPENGQGVAAEGPQHLEQELEETATSSPAGPVDDDADAKAFLSLAVLEKDVKANLEILAGLLGVKLWDINVKVLAKQLDGLSHLAGEQYTASEILDTFPEEDEHWQRWQSGRSPVGRMLGELTRDVEGN